MAASSLQPRAADAAPSPAPRAAWRAPWRLGSWAIAAIVAAPVLGVLANLAAPGGGALAHLAATTLPGIVADTLTLAAIVGVATAVIGVTCAWLVTMCRFPGSRALEWALLLPMAMPAYIVAYAYADFLAFAGPVQTALREATGWRRGAYWFPDIHSVGGAGAMFALVLYPYVFMLARAAFLEQSVCVLEASRMLGARAWRGFALVALPLARPAIAAGVALALMETLADFGTVQHFGIQTFTTAIYRTWYGMGDRVAAAQLSAMLLLAVLALLLLERASRGAARVHGAARRHSAIRPHALAGWRAASCAGATFLVVAAASLPLVVVCVSSFLDARGAVFQAEFTLENYQKAFALIGDALWNSVAYATAALFAIVVMGSAFGYYVSRYGGPLSRTLDLVAMIPFVVPGTVLGIGYASVFNGPPIYITGTAWIIVIVYIVRRMPYLTRAASSVVYQIDRGLEEASLNLGAPPLAGFRRIMVPLMRPGIMAGMTIAWLEVFNELSASIVLYTGATRTLPIAAYQQAFNGDIGIAAAYATMLVGITAATLAAVIRLGGAEQTLAIK